MKDITLDDLDDDDMYSLLSGGQQVLPKMDASGRAIYFRCDDYFTFRTWKSQVRARAWACAFLPMISFIEI